MDAKLHDKLIVQWKKLGSVYQTKERVQRRMPSFIKRVPIFKGLDVVEFGCNAGMHGYEIAQHANSYVGVDLGKYYVNQANVTKKYIENPNVEFVCSKANNFLKAIERGERGPYTGLFASYALYHLSKRETDRIAQLVLPTCNVVFIRTRTRKRTPFQNYNPRKFWKPGNVAKYLEESGMKIQGIYWEDEKRYADIIAVRESNGN